MILRLLTALTLIAVIVGTVLVGGGARSPVDRAAPAAGDQGPGYVARQAEIIETGPDGRPRYRLVADTIRQRPNETDISLEQLELRYVGEDGTNWRARADTGVVPQDGERIDLAGDVRLTGTLGDEPVPAEVRTQRLSVDTEAEVATTDAEVTIDWAGRQIAARGLRADLDARRLQLKSDVHGRYAP